MVLLIWVGTFTFQHSNSSTGSLLYFYSIKGQQPVQDTKETGKLWLFKTFVFVIPISALNEVNCNALDFSFQFLACA